MFSILALYEYGISVAVENHEVLSSVFKNTHVVRSGEVADKLNEKTDVGSTVEQILILKLFRLLIAKCLLKVTGASAVLADNIVVDHFAAATPYVLHLVSHYTSVDELNEAPFNQVDVQLCVAVLTSPRIFQRIFLVHRSRIQVNVSADVKVFGILAARADDIRNDEHKTRFVSKLGLWRELFEMTKRQQVLLESVSLERESWIECKQRADELGEL